ncbi:NAD(P)/FAD-dependent oxidoreductase [Anaerolentibacter hominis]|uniref:NAD(P)/FAD-dependent oxidoreductase n=1 Tax=Anaerolentibacter hominis TaxID=3079009 RepID=UPI0031B87A1B
MNRVMVIGGGAAGMMAAVAAAEEGSQVTLLEKNEKLGKKLFITGKGRCNLTNACDLDEIVQSIVSNPKFMYSSLYGFDNQMTIDFFEKLGCKTKVERGQRVFPQSDKSSDVIGAMVRVLRRLKVTILLDTEVSRIVKMEEGEELGVYLADGRLLTADRVIVATGGVSYPSTGSTGDGYRIAENLGHTVTKRLPSLVPLETKEDFARELQGLSLKNVGLTVKAGKRELYREQGEMLFTHFGISGPLVLSASSYAAAWIGREPVTAQIDLKPALTLDQLDARILRDFEQAGTKQLKNALDHLLPKRMIPVMIQLCGISPEAKVNTITREERRTLAGLLKALTLHVSGTRSFAEAIITKGGIRVGEINPATMESKKVPGLYFAGEVLDLDALTGGFNLQIAWSTGYAAGKAAAV